VITRIKEIKNVGKFKNFTNGGGVQFEKLTFIYGLNTRGKSTLTDLFCSLKENNPSIIENRKSIPKINSKQNIKLCTKFENESKESNTSFENGKWKNVNYQDNLHIFGSDFIHNNLFTGLTIERQNKENLTQFILGEEGVLLANQIAKEKKNLRAKKNSLKGLIPNYLKDKDDEEKKIFLELDINTLNYKELKDKKLNLENDLKNEKKRLDKPQELLSMEDLEEFKLPNNIIGELINSTNRLLTCDFSEISNESIEKLEQHLNCNFKKLDNSKQWIKEGLDFRNEDTNDCPFCGQSLLNASKLIETYNSYFNDEYRNFIKFINDEINKLTSDWYGLQYTFLNLINSKKFIVEKHKNFINEENLTKLVQELYRKIDVDFEEQFIRQINKYRKNIDNYLEIKKKAPHEIIKEIDFNYLLIENEKYFEKLNEIEKLYSAIKSEIIIFKEKYGDSTFIVKNIDRIKNELQVNEMYISRIEQHEECLKYLKEIDEISNIENRIKQKDILLSQNQENYLKTFFEKINDYFRSFGSKDFELEKGISKRGDQPIYYFKIKFLGEEINESNISKVFSESDKRALALSVFWAKLDILDIEKRKNAIVILDDPFTSFDDNRLTHSNTQLKNTLKTVRQIIILTHYSYFIRNFIERCKNDDISKSFVEICENNETNSLKKITEDEFTMTKYEIDFFEIYSYVNKENGNDIRNKLRIFLESHYIPHFFIDKLKKAKADGKSLEKLSEKIDIIFENDEKAKNKFHEFRTTLNPDSHISTSSNEEDIRSFAEDMITYLYNFSFKE